MLTHREKQELAAKLLQIPFEEIVEYSGEIQEIHALYVSVPIKGGPSLIVGEDGSVLYADSSIDETVHYREFLNGRRTPIEAFEVD